MNVQLSHSAAKEFFPALIDQELDAEREAQVRGHLVDCQDCRVRFEKYERAIDRIRGTERLQAPDALATLVLRRTQKKRHGLRAIVRAHDQYRVPFEILIPILAAVGVAAYLLLLA